MKNLQQIVEIITKNMPREILSFIIDKDILLYTVYGYTINYTADACKVDVDYVINTNNQWFGFDGWETDESFSKSSDEFKEYISSVWLSMQRKENDYYERN